MRENSSEETASARSKSHTPGPSALPSAPDLPTLFPHRCQTGPEHEAAGNSLGKQPEASPEAPVTLEEPRGLP